jgi:hypothetical protein
LASAGHPPRRRWWPRSPRAADRTTRSTPVDSGRTGTSIRAVRHMAPGRQGQTMSRSEGGRHAHPARNRWLPGGRSSPRSRGRTAVARGWSRQDCQCGPHAGRPPRGSVGGGRPAGRRPRGGGSVAGPPRCLDTAERGSNPPEETWSSNQSSSAARRAPVEEARRCRPT